jgi:hypothetical protein
MGFIEKRIASLTDEELHECYRDIKNYSESGVMGDTLVRKIRKEIVEEIGIENWDISCAQVLIPSLLVEMADRKYRNRYSDLELASLADAIHFVGSRRGLTDAEIMLLNRFEGDLRNRGYSWETKDIGLYSQKVIDQQN